MANICSTRRAVCKKTLENIGELRFFHPISEWKRDFHQLVSVSHKRKSGDYSIP